METILIDIVGRLEAIERLLTILASQSSIADDPETYDAFSQAVSRIETNRYFPSDPEYQSQQVAAGRLASVFMMVRELSNIDTPR